MITYDLTTYSNIWNVDLSATGIRVLLERLVEKGEGGGGSRKIRENRVVTGNTADSRDRRVFGGPLQNDQPAQ